MSNPITITPQDIVNVILAFCGAIITISAAFAVILKVVDHFKAPNKQQDEKIEALEKDVKEIKDRLEEGDRRFQKDYERMNDIEEGFRKVTKIIIESLQALTAHAIDGNNTEELKGAKKSLDNYLMNKI